MRFYLEYINHLGRLQKKSAQLVSLSNHRRPQAGFTITEVLLAGVMMLIAVLVSGIGVINLLRSNYRANADSEIRNNLNRTLEFVSDEVRRAKIIPQREADIVTTQVPEARAAGARAVLAFRIPDPNNPGQPLPNQIVYYTTGPENSLTGPRVLWRFGPNLDANGNYSTPEFINTWIRSPVTDMLAAAANNPNCPADFNLIAANPGNVDGFYACVRQGGGQVILNANAQVEMTTVTAGTRDKVDYAASTRVSTRAINDIFGLEPPPPGSAVGLGANLGVFSVPTIPVLNRPARITASVTVIQGPNCTSCTLAVTQSTPANILNPPLGSAITSTPSNFQANAGDALIIRVNGLRNNDFTGQNAIQAYTSTSPNSPRSLENNQVLLVFTTSTSPPNSYQVLLTITPR